jgi:hypothetical protein
MKITHNKKTYETIYYPFFRIDRQEDFDVYSLRLPSGSVEELIIFDKHTPSKELKAHLRFLLEEFALEEDDALTNTAKELKRDVRALFGID